MRLRSRIAVIAGVMALGTFPAVALGAAGGRSNLPTTHTTGTKQAKAYGKFCRGESKQHIAGTPGTAFSKCVTDMAKLANGSATNPAKACRNERSKHVTGQRGTPYSICVSGAKQLQKQQAGGSPATLRD